MAAERATAKPTIILRADEAPKSKKWEEGATFSLQTVDSKTTVLADGMTGIEFSRHGETRWGSLVDAMSIGGYIHKNTDQNKPVDDRGAMLELGRLQILERGKSQSRRTVHLGLELRGGRKLVKEASGTQVTLGEKNNFRSVLGLEYAHNPPSRGTPGGGPDPLWSFTLLGRTYLDRISWKTGGRASVSGGELGASIELAPLGIDPAAVKLGRSSLGFVPTIVVFGTAQDDFSASGDRTSDHRTLHGAKLKINFAPLEKEGLNPTFVLEYSDGADLLIARENSRVTKLALALKY